MLWRMFQFSDTFVNNIALDKDNRVVYYTDLKKHVIGRVSLSGDQKMIIQVEQDERPDQVQIDVQGG